MSRFIIAGVCFVVAVLSTSAGSTQDEHPFAVTIQKSEADQKDDADQRRETVEHDRSDLEAQWLAANSAKQMVYLSWVQLVLTVITVVAAGWSVKISRDTFISESRPILISETPEFPQGISRSEVPIPYNFLFSNEGKGAAFIRSVKIVWSNNSDIWNAETYMNFGKTTVHWPLAVGKVYGFKVEAGNTTDLDVQRRSRIERGLEELFVFAEIEYTGSGKKRYTMRSAYRWRPDTNRFVPLVKDDWWT